MLAYGSGKWRWMLCL